MGRLRIRPLLVYLGLTWMEACWVTGLFIIVAQLIIPHAPLSTVALIAGLMLVPLVTHGVLEWREAPALLRLLLIGGEAIVLYALMMRFHVYRLTANDPWFGRGLLALGGCALAWWRGLSLSQIDLAAPNAVLSRFWSDLKLMLVPLVVGPLMHLIGMAATSGLGGMDRLLMTFFPVSLVTMGLARLEEVSTIRQSTPVAVRSALWTWLTVGVAALAAAMGLLLVPFFAGGGLAQVLEWVQMALGALVVLLVTALLVLLVLLAMLMLPLLMLFFDMDWAWLSQGLAAGLEMLQNLDNILINPDNPGFAPTPEMARSIWLGMLIFVAVLIVGLVTWTSLRQRRRRMQAGLGTEERGTAEDLGEREPSLLERVRQRVAGVRTPSRRAALTIRAIYARLTRLAAQRGYPRWLAQTPYEYLPQLDRALPGCAEEVRTITQAYVLAHYGQVPDRPEELERVRRAWRRVREVTR